MMGSLQGVLKEEYARLKALEKKYIREIAKLPKGSLQEKRIKGRIYPYWVLSRRSKIHYRYLGNLPENRLRRLKEQLALKRKYMSLLKNVRQNKKQIEKIHGRK